MKDPAQCVRDLLVLALVGDLITNTSPTHPPFKICVGHLPESPDTIILVNKAPGRNPIPHLLLNEPSVHVLVRGAKNGYDAADQAARKVVTALLGMPRTTVQGDVYASCVQLSDTTYLGQDDNTRPLFSANFRFVVLPAAESGDNRVAIT